MKLAGRTLDGVTSSPGELNGTPSSPGELGRRKAEATLGLASDFWRGTRPGEVLREATGKVDARIELAGRLGEVGGRNGPRT